MPSATTTAARAKIVGAVYCSASRMTSPTAGCVGLAPPADVDASVDGLERQVAAAAADRPRHVTGTEAAGDGEGEIGVDPTVDGAGLDAGARRRGQLDRDGAVDGLQLERPGPVRASHGGRDGAVDGLRPG